MAAAAPAPLTFTALDAVHLAQAWPQATIVPLHFEGWAHFSEGETQIRRAFADAGLSERLHWLPPGKRTALR